MWLTSIISVFWRENKLYRWYTILIAAALIKQWFSLSILVDSTEYRNAAYNLLHHLNLDSCLTENCDHILHHTRRTPGYPLLILLTGFAFPVLIFLQAVIALLIPVWSKIIIDELKLPSPVFEKFMWLFLLYPLQYFYAVIPMPEIWCQWLVLIGILFWLRKKFTLLALSVVILVLLKPVFLLVAILLAIYAFFHLRKRAVLFLPAIVMLLISYLNQLRTDKFHYTSMGVENAWEYNQRAVLNKVMTASERENYFRKHDSIFQTTSFAESYSIMSQETKKNIVAHWKLYTWHHLKGCVIAALDPGRYDALAFLQLKGGEGVMSVKEEGGMLQKIIDQPMAILVYMILFLCINMLRWIVVIVALFRSSKIWWLMLLLVLLFVGVTGPVGSARYMFPFMPLLCIMAAHGWYLMRNKIEQDTPAQR